MSDKKKSPPKSPQPEFEIPQLDSEEDEDPYEFPKSFNCDLSNRKFKEFHKKIMQGLSQLPIKVKEGDDAPRDLMHTLTTVVPKLAERYDEMLKIEKSLEADAQEIKEIQERMAMLESTATGEDTKRPASNKLKKKLQDEERK